MRAAPAIDFRDATPGQRIALAERLWRTIARPDQVEPEGAWRTWLIRSGRGAGKTRTGAEWIRERVEAGARRIHLVAESAAEVRSVVVEGESGILEAFPPYKRPVYEPSKRKLTFHTGAIGLTFAGDAPDQLRGPQCDSCWIDELAKFDYPRECVDNAQMGLRLESSAGPPRMLVTTTPRPLPVIRQLCADPETHVTVTSTYANVHLDPGTLAYLKRRYEGTRTGRQELLGEILEDVEGAIVSHEMIDAARVDSPPDLTRVVIGVDPAATSGEDSDETGIVAAGKGDDGQGYVLADRSGRLPPAGWGRRVVDLYRELEADRIVAEKNNGGEMVAHVIRTIDRTVPVKLVSATRGKHVRFEPIGSLYEQGRISHVGHFTQLEDQVCGFTPQGYEGGESPDHADAAVWALSELLIQGRTTWEDLYQ